MHFKRTFLLKPTLWFKWIVGLLLALVTLYGVLHYSLPTGRSSTKLTVADMTNLSALLYEQGETRPVSTSVTNGSVTSGIIMPASSSALASTSSLNASVPTSQRSLTTIQRQHVFGYIVNTYPIDSSDAHTLEEWVGLFGQPGTLMNALKDHVFPVKSYFWLTGGGLYWEIIFWTWFGLIASLLFNVSESLRTPPHKLIQNETWTHIAKFFYAPLCSIAIFLGLSLAITDQKVLDQVNFSPNQILVAFILGFFSGRVIDLLQRIKNVILPDGTVATPVTTLPITSSTAGTVGLHSPSLGLNDVETIIRQHGALWMKAYPNVTGLAAQIKTTAGQPTGEASILFEVNKKMAGMSVGIVPPAFNVTMPDGRQVVLPTDVEEVGVTRFNYNAGQSEIHIGVVPTALGSSVVGITQKALPTDKENWGTIGLRVHDSSGEFLLTCCHVVCGPLIDSPDWTYRKAQHGKVEVVIPTNKTSLKIGEVTQASFNSREDFAVIRLDNPADVANQLAGLGIKFTDFERQLDDRLRNNFAQMVGARSNYQFAEITAVYQEGIYEDVPGLVFPVRMQGLIKTKLISDKGDSGAAIFIRKTLDDNVVLGLLIADNDEYSYILPLRDYLTNNGYKLTI